MVTFETLSYRIDEEFPEFKKTLDPKTYTDDDRDKVYVYVNQFSKYFILKTKELGTDDPFVQNVLNFINQNYSSTENDVRGVFMVLFFDKLAADSKLNDMALKCFKDLALEDFVATNREHKT